MQLSDLRREIERFDPEVALAEASTPPASWYLEPGIWDLERRHVFGASWQFAARLDQLTEAGHFVAGCTAGEPWLVVRSDDGQLRAFSNACRHKATPVAEGAGFTGLLQCPYHGWTYRLDGTLHAAPRMGSISDFSRDDHALRPLPVDTWGPLVFVGLRADSSPPPLRAAVGDLARAFDGTGWETARWVERRSYPVACNWKVFCDNYLDGGYHVPLLHASLDAQLDMTRYRTETFERSSVQTCAAATKPDDRTAVDPIQRIGPGAVYGWLYPNFMINRYGPVLDTNLILPLGPDRCEVIFDFYFDDPEGNPAFVEQSITQSDLTQQEDVRVSERVQVGLGSASYDRGRYAPAFEIGIHHFHRLLAADLRASLGRDR